MAGIADKIRTEFSKWLSLPNYDTVDIVGATLLANRLPGKPLWLAIVGPPATGKTEVVQALEGCARVHMIDGLTPATFASGFRISKKSTQRFGLLAQMDDGEPHMIVVKDFSTVLQKRADQRGEILGQLRNLYDGKYFHPFGNDVTVSWRGKLGMIVCSTGQYDKELRSLAVFGDRFMVFRPPEGSREHVAERAGRNAGLAKEMELALRGAYGLLDSIKIPKASPRVPLGARRMIADLADFVTRARSQVPRNPYNRSVEDLPEIEGTARVAVQLNQLVKGLMLYFEREAIVDHDVDLAETLTFSTIPLIRSKVLSAMDLQGRMSGLDIARAMGVPGEVVRRTIEDLVLLEVLEHQGGQLHDPKSGWAIAKRWKPFVYRLQRWLETVDSSARALGLRRESDGSDDDPGGSENGVGSGAGEAGDGLPDSESSGGSSGDSPVEGTGGSVPVRGGPGKRMLRPRRTKDHVESANPKRDPT